MEPFNLHHPNVEIIWNFYPFNWFILPPLSWTLNVIILPVTLVIWPLWEIWNFLNLFWAVLFFPAWLIGFIFYNITLILGWIALSVLSIIPLVSLFFVATFVSVQTGNWVFGLLAILLLGAVTLSFFAILWFLIFALPTGLIVGIIIAATVPCINEDATAECVEKR